MQRTVSHLPLRRVKGMPQKRLTFLWRNTSALTKGFDKRCCQIRSLHKKPRLFPYEIKVDVMEDCSLKANKGASDPYNRPHILMEEPSLISSGDFSSVVVYLGKYAHVGIHYAHAYPLTHVRYKFCEVNRLNVQAEF